MRSFYGCLSAKLNLRTAHAQYDCRKRIAHSNTLRMAENAILKFSKVSAPVEQLARRTNAQFGTLSSIVDVAALQGVLPKHSV